MDSQFHATILPPQCCRTAARNRSNCSAGPDVNLTRPWARSHEQLFSALHAHEHVTESTSGGRRPGDSATSPPLIQGPLCLLMNVTGLPQMEGGGSMPRSESSSICPPRQSRNASSCTQAAHVSGIQAQPLLEPPTGDQSEELPCVVYNPTHRILCAQLAAPALHTIGRRFEVANCLNGTSALHAPRRNSSPRTSKIS